MSTLLTYENHKLKKQLIFNLPVSKQICGRECPGCYARKAQVRFPKTVLPSREIKHTASLQSDFVSRVVAEITTFKRQLTAVRIHEAGEFYSQEYIDKWAQIATACPTITFYAFTKRMSEFNFTALMSLPNMVIIDSLMHGRKLNYGKEATLSKTVFTCPATGCGTTCQYCMTKTAQSNGIQFIQH